MANKLRSKDFYKLDIHSDQTISLAMAILKKNFKHHSNDEKLNLIKQIKASPEKYLDTPNLQVIAGALCESVSVEEELLKVEERDVPLQIFGDAIIKPNAIKQMRTALNLPIVEKGALMPDSHLGYGLPIGGVLATKQCVIPYAIGMDIGCRMSLSIYDCTERFFNMHHHKFKQSIIKHTAFGLNKVVGHKQEHEFIDRDIFSRNSLLKNLKSKAAKQLGSSGSGNHFVEWGIIDLEQDQVIGIPAGKYIGLLAHSGSRGFGASIAKHYSELAKANSRLPYNLRHLAWLDLADQDGEDYWDAMNLAGDYARACHDQIHKNLAKAMGLKSIRKIENHHNFAWKEIIDGQELIVHRKGATPAGKDVLGIIPGSMTDPGFIVKGLGNPDSIQSASHGAGRKHSRQETKSRNTNSEMQKQLKQQKVTLIGGALDESPFAYKSLEKVMSYQSNLVTKVGKFTPRIVRMDRAK